MDDMTRQFLVFSLHGNSYAIDLAKVAEVCDPPILFPAPSAPECFRGAFNFHGEIVAAVDISTFIGYQAQQSFEKVIVLNSSIAALAITTDAAMTVINESDATVTMQPKQVLSTGLISFTAGDAILLDIDGLVAAIADVTTYV